MYWTLSDIQFIIPETAFHYERRWILFFPNPGTLLMEGTYGSLPNPPFPVWGVAGGRQPPASVYALVHAFQWRFGRFRYKSYQRQAICENIGCVAPSNVSKQGEDYGDFQNGIWKRCVQNVSGMADVLSDVYWEFWISRWKRMVCRIYYDGTKVGK